ncbi:MAG TPA: DUF2254 family protein, partial [Thermomicrobiales bacterium]|nr:DUF2254 family protein [Thermomicrobiales bacterium]
IGDERTFSQDPKYVLRILSDIGVRALSPGINDPTTATDVLNVVERLLGYLAARNLGDGLQCDDAGELRVEFPVADWEDFVSVALDEIRLYGIQSAQVSRRLICVLETLIADVPEKRRPVLLDRLDRTRRAVAALYPDPDDRALALAPDAQGLGGTRPSVGTSD